MVLWFSTLNLSCWASLVLITDRLPRMWPYGANNYNDVAMAACDLGSRRPKRGRGVMDVELVRTASPQRHRNKRTVGKGIVGTASKS